MAQVTLEKLHKRYDKTDIIQDVNLAIADREFIVLVGPSGCGKSTILRMIAGLEPISDGQISIGDRVVNDVAPKDRDIAMVFQSYALYPHMSVYDNMAFGLKMRKTPKADIRRRVEEAAQILDLTHLLTRKPKQLSGGQRQRVALGRAIVRDPKVFLMDEPLSNLDAKLRVQMRTEIQKLHRRLNATTIYVTHDQVEAMTMGDRIVILNGGKIQQAGVPDTIYAYPANVFVGGFIGSMVFLTLPTADGTLALPDGSRWPLPAPMADAVRAQGLDQVQVGIRPEHFYPLHGASADISLTVTPDIVEMLGYEKLIHFNFLDKTITAALPPDAAVTEGAPIALGLRLDKISLFHPQTGLNLLPIPG